MKKILNLLIFSLVSSLVHAENIGLSTYDFQQKETYLSAEVLAKVSVDDGLGFQARFTHVFDPKFYGDLAYQFHTGDRDHRLGLGGTYELFPDHQLQPRISIKGLVELVDNDDSIATIVGVIPTVSKAISWYNVKMYPFAGLPVKRLIGSNSRYEIAGAVGLGVHFSDELIFNFEHTFNLRNTASSFTFGITTSL